MNVLITGATGFVGYHLAKRLTDQGHSVRCLVRKSSKIYLLKNLNVQLFYGDLLCVKSLEGVAKDIHIVYHLAGIVYSRKREEFNQGNLFGTANLLEQSKRENISKFVYISSLAVYKPPQEKVLLNEAAPCYPITSYGESKLKTEELILQFYRKYNLPVVLLRAPIIYGPYQSRILTNFFIEIIKKKKAVIIGDGEYLRSLCYVDNFIDALILVSETEKSTGQIYNISDKDTYTFNTLLSVASKIIRAPIRIVRLSKSIGEIVWNISKLSEKYCGIFFIEAYGLKTMTTNLGCNISKIKEDLGYNPVVELEEGLAKTFKWIIQEYRL